MFTKRISWLSFGACCLLQVALASPVARAASPSSDSSGGAKVDVNFFYDTLKDDGSWFNTTDYGDVWQPYIAYKSDSWRPYTDGYWTYTDGGWMFVSNENFGWAVYHYGRWTKLKDIGWAWVPGTDWAPAWVTWRTSNPDGAQVAATGVPTDDKNPPPDAAPAEPNGPPPPAEGRPAPAASENYIGWAPLPPAPVSYGPDYAYGPTVDVDFGIDPYDYCFTDYRYFGAPYIAAVIFDPFRSYACCERSVNITNIYYNRRGGYRGFYNGGPNFDRFRGVTERPIPQYQLRRSTSGALAQRDIRAGQFNRINGNTLNVAAPNFSTRNVKNGRVNFTQRGALPVTPVNHGAPASVANDERYKRAQEAFKRQGETARAQGGGQRGATPNTPNAQGLTRQGGNPANEPRIATTPAAQKAERQARQKANAASPAQSGNPATAGQPGENRPNGANPATTKAERRAARQAAREGSTNAASATSNDQAREARRAARANNAGRQAQGEADQARQAQRAARQEARQQAAPVREARVREAAPRPAPQAPRGGGGGGGHAEEGGEKGKKKPQGH